MAWRNTLITRFGAGLLCGITFRDWAKLFRDNFTTFDPRCLPRAMAITFQSVQNSAFHRYENWRFARKLDDVIVEPPIFVLGHWRNGTTHLHNLLTVDERFAFPNLYQSFFPHSFLSTEATSSPVIGLFLPKQRPMDNVALNMQTPQEDEFALCISSLKSPLMGWAFPQKRAHYDKYLTFRDVSDAEITEWENAFVLFLKKLTWKCGRPLILKSPPHTARIKLLLKMFPQAKFIHIHRNPYVVFQSTKKMLKVNFEMQRLQRVRSDDLDEWILQQYRQMYDAFFQERSLIPAGQFHEIGYEELEPDPMGQIKRLYEALNLPDFGQTREALQSYVCSIANYKKNEFADLPADLRNRILVKWAKCFDEWDYPV
jgi:hypothetical protein